MFDFVSSHNILLLLLFFLCIFFSSRKNANTYTVFMLYLWGQLMNGYVDNLENKNEKKGQRERGKRKQNRKC